MNPFLSFAGIWSLVFSLHYFHILYFYEDFSWKALYSIISGYIAALLITRVFGWNTALMTSDAREDQLRQIRAFLIFAFFIVLAIFFFELAIFKGLPLLWLLTGDSRTYADFGITSLHGFFNALLLFVATVAGGFVIIQFDTRRSAIILGIAVLLMVVLYSRAMIFITLIQLGSVALFILFRKMRTKHYLYSMAIVIFLMFGFGVMGNLRLDCSDVALPKDNPIVDTKTASLPFKSRKALAVSDDSSTSPNDMLAFTSGGCNVYTFMVDNRRADLFRFIPSEFLWFYAYSTGGLNNLIFNLEKADQNYTPRYTLAKLIPTAAYKYLNIEKKYDNFTLAHPAFTVSTAYAGVVSDFGYFGFSFTIPLLLISFAFYKKAISGSFSHIIIYSMLFQSIILSPFIDTVLYSTFLLQMALVYIAGSKAMRMSAIKHRYAQIISNERNQR